MSRVTVVGLGYVGLPLAVHAAEAGHQVVGLDLDLRRIGALQEGTSYVEDVTDSRLRAVLDAGSFRPEVPQVSGEDSPRTAPFDIGIIAVPTPLRDGEPDLSYVESAGWVLGQGLEPGAAVVLESTTYPGTTEGLLAEVLQRRSGLVPGAQFHLGFSPERIDPGHKVYSLQNTPKLVSATTAEGLAAIRAFYDTIVDRTVPVSSPRVAEMTKLFENIQANVCIALINEVSVLCHEMSIDVWEMIDASMTKGHSMARWTPGPGVGGHCLPIDPLYLAWQARTQLGRRFRFAELADEVNKGRPAYVVDRAAELLESRSTPLDGADVLVVGAAYKPGVGDTRESPALDVVAGLQQRGAHVTVVDPHVSEWSLSPVLSAEDLLDALPGFSLVVIVTDHSEFDYGKIAEVAPLVLDCRNALPRGDNVVAL